MADRLDLAWRELREPAAETLHPAAPPALQHLFSLTCAPDVTQGVNCRGVETISGLECLNCRAMSELLQALYTGDKPRADELLAANPELNVFEAAACGQTERLRELLDNDPSLANAFEEDGFHPLGLACFFGQLDAARLLLDRGAAVNELSRNEHIQTAAIHAAAASGEEGTDEPQRYELVKLVLDHGADPNLRQGGGSRAIDAARQNGDESVERLLKERGAED